MGGTCRDGKREERGGWRALAGIGVLTLLGLYVGAYFALVRPGRVGTIRMHAGRQTMFEDVVPVYDQILGIQTDRIFSPMHAIDRKLRPKMWTADPPMPLDDFSDS